MVNLRLRYENGRFLPLEPVQGISEGEEIVVHFDAPSSNHEAIREMLARTAGLWMDVEGIEAFLVEARNTWDEEWKARQKMWGEE